MSKAFPSQQTAISIQHVSKTFYQEIDPPSGLKAAIIRSFTGRGKKARVTPALQDVTIDVAPGRAHALIGNNGSGKTTLLKVVARILSPDQGTVTTNGRVAALLELGAGFHPDLTGRENVYLNGSILGLTRAEINERFDEIVAFSQLGDAVYAPVKTYSSGMYVRLGFAVAINVRPQVLLIDEIFAVGDASFQRKCREAVTALRENGTTILFVSHDTEAVASICDTATWLDHGIPRATGAVGKVIEAYLHDDAPPKQAAALSSAGQSGSATKLLADEQLHTPDLVKEHGIISLDTLPEEFLTRPPSPQDHLVLRLQERGHLDLNRPSRYGDGAAKIQSISLVQDGEHVPELQPGQNFSIIITYQVVKSQGMVLGVGLHTPQGLHIAGPNTKDADFELPSEVGQQSVQVELSLRLKPGQYLLSIALYDTCIAVPLDHCHKWFVIHVRGPVGGAGLMEPEATWTALDGGDE